MQRKIDELTKALFNAKKLPKDLNIFLITEKEYVRVHNGLHSGGVQSEDYGLIKNLKLDRGQILSIFSKLEFLLRELISLKLLEYNAEKRQMMDDILENLRLHQMIEIINEWGIVDNTAKNKLIELKKVRNSFAHSWSKYEVYYEGKPIKSVFEKFKLDFLEVWKILIERYKIEQEKIDIDKIINSIKNIN